MSDALINSLTTAVELAPDDPELRLHLAKLLVDAGRAGEAVSHIAVVLAADPSSDRARSLMAAAISGAAPAAPAAPAASESEAPSGRPLAEPEFDWHAAEGDLGDVIPPMFVDGSDGTDPAAQVEETFDIEDSGIRLTDVGGMKQVKDRINAAFLAPMQNPELRALYGKSLKGGLLLYGPPGCGKTFVARAVAGELGAKFIAISLADILDMYIGNSERNVHELFEMARRNAPCVVFLDEVDAIGQKRSQLRNSGMRGTVNQLLNEMDSVGSDNEGVFVLAATNHPWDVDVALRRPGRFDRTVLVLPPDEEARASILQYHLTGRPIAGIDLRKLAKATDNLSGADLAHLCDTAAEHAMLDSIKTGQVRMITMADFAAAGKEVKSSIGPWLETARNVAMFSNSSGDYDELAAYLKKRKLL